MTVFWAVRKGDALYPDSQESYAEFAKLPFGKSISVEAKRPRNAGRHRFYWMLVTRVATAMGVAPETVSDVLKIATGNCTTVRTKSYGDVRLPKSISYAAMDETAFGAFVEACIQVIQTEWAIERADLLEATADLLTPTEQHG